MLDGVSVYRARLRMGEKLAHNILRSWPDHDIDVVIPIPDTSRTSALECAATLGIKYREGFIKNRYVGRTFIMPDQGLRKKTVRHTRSTPHQPSPAPVTPHQPRATPYQPHTPSHTLSSLIPPSHSLTPPPPTPSQVRQKLSPIGSELINRNVLLVDDSIVRGTTSSQVRGHAALTLPLTLTPTLTLTLPTDH